MKVQLTQTIEVKSLTQKNCEQLVEWGYPISDIAQIDEAAKECTYTDYNPKLYGDNKDHRISRKKVIEKLGDEQFLSGISRAAFHASSCREYGNGTDRENQPYIYFDLYKWWK